MPKFAVYDSEHVTILAPIPITDGLAVENFVRVEFPDRYGHLTGIDRRVLRYTKLGQIARVTLKLLGYSPHNQELSEMHRVDITRGDGSGVGGFLIKDEAGASLFTAHRSWIVGLPPLEFGERREDVTWRFDCVYTPEGCIIGGNGTPL